MKTINVYSIGLCYASVCANKKYTIEEITSFLNETYPTGISSQWNHSNESFRTGEVNPHLCEKDSNKLHYLFSC